MRFAKVNEAIWSDKKFNSVSDSSRLLYIYLLSCSRCNSVGIFQVGLGTMEDDFCHPRDEIRQSLAELEDAGLVKYMDGWVWFSKFLKWNEPSSPNHARRCASDLNDCVMKNAPREAVCNFLGSVRPILNGMKFKGSDKTYYDEFRAVMDWPLTSEFMGGDEALKKCLTSGSCGLGKARKTDDAEALQKDLPSTEEVLQKTFGSTATNKNKKEKENRSTREKDEKAFSSCKSKEPSEVSLFCSDGLPLAVGQSAVSLALARFSEDERHRVIIEAQKRTISSPIERGTQDKWFADFVQNHAREVL